MKEAPSTADDGSEKPAETISQFIARVLSQLSLVAWLPSGALVLALTFIFQLNTVLDSKTKPKGASDAISKTFEAMAGMGFSGALLLFVAVIVLTILTQIFAFDADLVLQGHWGTLRLVEWVAKRRCTHFRNQCTKLYIRKERLLKQAENAGRAEIERRQAGDVDWEIYAPPDLWRREKNLSMRLDDFPWTDFPWLSQIMPTRLGNIMRSCIIELERDAVQTFVLEIYNRLPTHLQSEHDQWRDRLDLYCSMVFVAAFTTVVATLVLAPQHWRYASFAVLAGAVAMWLAYRGAIAAARRYGSLLVFMKDCSLAPVEGSGSESEGT